MCLPWIYNKQLKSFLFLRQAYAATSMLGLKGWKCGFDQQKPSDSAPEKYRCQKTLWHQNAGSLKNLCFTNFGNCFSACKTIRTIFNRHGSSELMKIKEIKCLYFLRAINARFSINNICEITLLNVLFETFFTLGLLNILTLPK